MERFQMWHIFASMRNSTQGLAGLRRSAKSVRTRSEHFAVGLPTFSSLRLLLARAGGSYLVRAVSPVRRFEALQIFDFGIYA